MAVVPPRRLSCGNNSAELRQLIRTILIRALASLAAAVALAYLVDSFVIWRKASSDHAAAFGTVQVLLTTPSKGNRLEIFADQPQTVTCVHALFPHYGASPCWYVQRHSTQIIN